jgi:hypothetical protein
MRIVFKILGTTGLLVGLAALGSAADKTLSGQISDSQCGASHAKMMEMHKDAKMTDRDCTLACVKNGGKYVFVSGGKVYNIANQDFAALQQYAGDNVRLTGAVSGDTITVSKISAGKKKS